MCSKYKLARVAIILAGLALPGLQPLHASNGMNMIGFGAESMGMGGADLAITGSPSSMNINPAGIGRLQKARIALGLSPLFPSLTHEDKIGNNLDDVLDRMPMPYIGYVHPVRRISFGIGLFVQGGMGAEYKDLVTPVAARAASGQLPPGFFTNDLVPVGDDIRTRIMHAKLTPSVAWRVNPKLTVGLGLNISYARADMRFFPETSVLADLDMSGTEGDSPLDRFAGIDAEDMSGTGFGARIGFQYEIGKLSLGGAYCTETKLEFDGGTASLNLSSIGLGKVTYDSRITGFNWPQQAGVGAAYQVSPRLLVAADIDWVDWSGAIGTLNVELDNPDKQPPAPPNKVMPFQMDWEDQTVIAVGMEYTARPDLSLRLGYNHSGSPIPDDRLRPHFPAIGEDHLTGGAGYSVGPWLFDFGLEYVLKATQTNTSSEPALNPLGPGSTESLSHISLHFMVERAIE